MRHKKEERTPDRELAERVNFMRAMLGGLINTSEYFFCGDFDGLAFKYLGPVQNINAFCEQKKTRCPIFYLQDENPKEDEEVLWKIGGLHLNVGLSLSSVIFYSGKNIFLMPPLYILPFTPEPGLEDEYVFFAYQIKVGKEYRLELSQQRDSATVEVCLFEPKLEVQEEKYELN